jgi:hypothetical protein
MRSLNSEHFKNYAGGLQSIGTIAALIVRGISPSVAVGNSRQAVSDYLFQWGPWVFSGLLVVVGGLQAWWLMLTWQAIQKQVSAQRTAERAWLIISLANWRPTLFIEEQSNKLASQNAFQVTIKNVGRTPAHLTKVANRYIKLDKTQFESLSKEADYGPIESLVSVILVPEDSLSATVPLEPSPMLTRQEIESIHTADSFSLFLRLY